MIVRRGDLAAPLRVRSLSAAYRGVPALWDVTWEAREAAMTAIAGPNGAGKSTLLNAAIGAIRPIAGEAIFWGRPFEESRARDAYVPQREAVDWDFPVTALEVVEMGAARAADWWLPRWVRRGPARAGAQARALSQLEAVGLGTFADRPIGQLSGGQQQRVFLARALAQEADLLLLDEPFAGVDAETEEALFALLRERCDAGATVVAVHHDLQSARERFDDALLLAGSPVASGPAPATLTDGNLRRAFAAPAGAPVELA